MKMKILLLTAAIMLLLAGCGSSTSKKEGNKTVADTNYPQLTAEIADKDRVVEMQTTMGNIKIKLFPEYAPKAVENFVKHSEDGYYNGLIFHRVINDFMIQGGDPNGNGTGGKSIYGKPFEDEFSDKLYNIRGALSMANSGANTNGSQFFIVQAAKVSPSMIEQMEKTNYPQKMINTYKKKGGTPWLDGRHTVFGQVIEGMDVVDKIAGTPVEAQDKPKEDIMIKKIEVIQ